MKRRFAPGCALKNYKPELISEISRFLRERSLTDGEYPVCCKAGEALAEKAALIVCCPGCALHFAELYPDSPVYSLWELLNETDFPFPDYHGARMSIHDACHARHRNSSEMQDSVRRLCRRMNIELAEPEYTRDEARCCGGSAGNPEARREMALSRAAEFPEKDVVVYCTGCVRSFSVTEAKPRHVLDLLFEEPTEGLYPPA